MKNYKKKIQNNDNVIFDEVFLYSQAVQHINTHYKLNQHHVATVLICNGNIYKSLHLDSDGIDTCAEPIALTNALQAGETQFDKIISVLWNGDKSIKPRIVSPCGNCRQILTQYAPDMLVVVGKTSDGFELVPSIELLPHGYSKPF